MGLRQNVRLLGQFQKISNNVVCAHSEDEMLEVCEGIFALASGVPGVIVEAGCWKGGSSCKFSLAAALVDRDFVVFDSFEGIPENDDAGTPTIYGNTCIRFNKGDYAATQEEVRENLGNFGSVENTRLIHGWFEGTLPSFSEPVALAYLDVDLVSSTLTCLKYLWPLLSPGGTIFSQDGHLHNVLEAISDDAWWQKELSQPAPTIHGIWKKKLVSMNKPSS